MKILIIADQRSGALKSSALEIATTASSLASDPSSVAALIIGKGIAGLSSELAGYGVEKVFTVEDDSLEDYNVLNYAHAAQKAIDSFAPELVLGSASPLGRDLFPRLAARNDAGLMTDIISLESKDGSLHGVKPMFAGKALAHLTFSGDGIKFATIRPNTVQPSSSGSGSATGEGLAYDGSQDLLKTLEIRKGESQKADLTEATKIISGGRAMGSADAFKILHECAETMNATVGASRAAVDSGYASHDMQVGQTGKTVNPSLYIACGISGSIQHMAGMRTSKTIVAINTDPEAPIFKVADYGIVADLFEAVPILTKKLKELNL